MGTVMKKLVLTAAVLAMAAGSAFAADMPLKAVKAPPPAPFEPWDIAFGSALMNDYIFRGVTQSNHQPSVTAYFEPRYNVTKDLQLYIGTSTESIAFSNRAAAEVDVYGGIRPTFGAFAFDLGVWGYLYPGGICADNVLTGGIPGGGVCPVSTTTIFLADGNVMKKNVSFFEVYGKVNYTINDNWQFGVNEYYSPNFLNSGAWGNYASITGKYTAPSTTFGTSGVGMYVSGEFGRQWLGTSDAFYGLPGTSSRLASPTPATTPGTSASVSPTRCLRWMCDTPTPTCRRAIATLSRAHSMPPEQPTLRRSILAAPVRTGAAQPASSSSRLT
jgi:uncharacterized protein (TIGR02001 family)